MLGKYLVPMLAALAAAFALAAGVQTWRLDSCETAAAAFALKVKAEGEAALRQNSAIEAADRVRKERANAERDRRYADYERAIAGLRESGAGSGPPAFAGPPTQCADGTAVDKADIERAWRALAEGVRGLLDEGTRAQVDLDVAKEWARGDSQVARP